MSQRTGKVEPSLKDTQAIGEVVDATNFVDANRHPGSYRNVAACGRPLHRALDQMLVVFNERHRVPLCTRLQKRNEGCG